MPYSHSEYMRHYRKANADKIKAYNQARAETAKVYQSQYRAEHKEQLRQYFKDHYQSNKETRKAQSKAYREANREQYIAYLKKYVQDHKDEHRERGRRWLKENREHNNAKCRERHAANPLLARARNKRYYELHPEQKKLMKAKRRARIAEQPCTVTAGDIRELYARQGGKCYWCQKSYGKRPHLAHVYPLARGGANSKENVVLACKTCNLSKGAKTPMEWAGVLL